MASAADPFPIYYNPDVHNFYIKQKQEFHFNQKSDNEFLMFLLDTAVRVISIVQHLAPVIEAVSDASTDIDDIDDLSPNSHIAAASITGNSMDVDTATVPPLSVELEQINQEITNSQISSKSQSNFSTTRYEASPLIPIEPDVIQTTPQTALPDQTLMHTAASTQAVKQTPAQSSIQTSVSLQTVLQNTVQTASPPLFQNTPNQSSVANVTVPKSSLITPPAVTQPSSALYHEPLTPNVPATQQPTSCQSSENLPTVIPSAIQPIAQSASKDAVKSEQPVPEVIDIKEEIEESDEPGNELLTQDSLQQLMTSISAADVSSGLQNFVPTATPSSLPPSFLDRTSKNPLSMVGSLNTGDFPGPSGINVPCIPESMMKNISDAGLNVSGVKGQANPRSLYACHYCSKVLTTATGIRQHTQIVHMKKRARYKCRQCDKMFSYMSSRRYHEKTSCRNRPMK